MFGNFYTITALFSKITTTSADETKASAALEFVGLFVNAVMTAWFHDKIEYIGIAINGFRVVMACLFVLMILYYSYVLFKKVSQFKKQ